MGKHDRCIYQAQKYLCKSNQNGKKLLFLDYAKNLKALELPHSATISWAVRKQMKKGKARFALAHFGGKIFVIGGETGHNVSTLLYLCLLVALMLLCPSQGAASTGTTKEAS